MAALGKATSGRLKWAEFFRLSSVPLVLILVGFVMFWLSGWVAVDTAMQICGLMCLVVLGATGYKVFISSRNRLGVGFEITLHSLLVVCFAIPLWGSDKLVPVVVGAVSTGALLTLLHLRSRRDERPGEPG